VQITFAEQGTSFQVEGVFYVNDHLEKLMLEELRNSCRPGMVGGFLPGVKQIANVAALPGIVGRSVGLPDVHSGYGFAIGRLHSLFSWYSKTCEVHISGKYKKLFIFHLATSCR
jgi:hypothetical protein